MAKFRELGFPLLWVLVFGGAEAAGQSLGGAGTLKGIVMDSTAATLPSARVELSNPVSGFSRRTLAGPDGVFVIHNIPPNSYRLRISFSGFEPYDNELAIRTIVPIDVSIRLTVAGRQTSVKVEGAAENLLENVPAVSNTVDRRLLAALPAVSPDSGLNDAITVHDRRSRRRFKWFLSSPRRPCAGQLRHRWSTHIRPAQQGFLDLDSRQCHSVDGSDLRLARKPSMAIRPASSSTPPRAPDSARNPAGSLLATYGSFGAIGEEATLGLGNARLGSFTVLNAERSGRFLDTPEFRPLHDTGNTGTFFERIDFQPGARDSFHLNLLAARNWMQVPNTYDQPRQDQRQKVVSFNIAPGYQRTLGCAERCSA